jgi:hypothetical protein
MGASYEILKEIVRSRANLTLTKSVSDDQLRELVKLSTQSGSRISIPTSMGYDVICELARTGQKHVTLLTRKLASVAKSQQVLPLAKVTHEAHAFGDLKRCHDAPLDLIAALSGALAS